MRNGKERVAVGLRLAKETEKALGFVDEDRPKRHLWVAKQHAQITSRRPTADGAWEVVVLLPRWLLTRWKLL